MNTKSLFESLLEDIQNESLFLERFTSAALNIERCIQKNVSTFLAENYNATTEFVSLWAEDMITFFLDNAKLGVSFFDLERSISKAGNVYIKIYSLPPTEEQESVRFSKLIYNDEFQILINSLVSICKTCLADYAEFYKEPRMYREDEDIVFRIVLKPLNYIKDDIRSEFYVEEVPYLPKSYTSRKPKYPEEGKRIPRDRFMGTLIKQQLKRLRESIDDEEIIEKNNRIENRGKLYKKISRALKRLEKLVEDLLYDRKRYLEEEEIEFLEDLYMLIDDLINLERERLANEKGEII